MAAKNAQELEAQMRSFNKSRQAQQDIEKGEQFAADKVAFGTTASSFFDADLYGQETSYVSELNDEMDVEEEVAAPAKRSYTAPQAVLSEVMSMDQDVADPFAETRAKRISDREDAYRAQRRNRIISPERADPFADDGSNTPKPGRGATYADVMMNQELDKERKDIEKQLREKQLEQKKSRRCPPRPCCCHQRAGERNQKAALGQPGCSRACNAGSTGRGLGPGRDAKGVVKVGRSHSGPETKPLG